jgi:uncharacterized protein YndB with AHSA1/START domain
MPTTLTNQPRTLRVRKTYNATRQEIFDAWTDPESFKRWMSPEGVTVTYLATDVRVGGAYRIDMQPGAETIVHTGVYQVVEPPAKLVFTWISKNTLEKETLVTVELFERGPRLSNCPVRNPPRGMNLVGRVFLTSWLLTSREGTHPL